MTDETVFAAALAIADQAKRAEYLDRACAGNPKLRSEVEALLAAAASDNPLDRPPADLGRTGAYVPDKMKSEPTAAVGDRVGPYKLLELIGEGGMGEVWVADQLEPIKRRVALKLIKPGMDSRSVLGRFEAERQALAVMDHPNIAKVLDAGTTADGRPYFVMELVKGTPITEFADARKLTPKQRLELFVPVCQAIQHAHMKGIIHRDIKPSNVLVALHDETPVPKVIDFGVAKAIGQQLTEKTIYTGFGALVGTPVYMAPEQASFNQLDVDTRADVYALGVLLYELLAGSPPIEKDRLKKAALDEVLRIVRDEEPPRPSQRLSTSQAKASIAATRGSEPAKLSALMKGELDWIVMKALEKDRTRRYETANGFAADIQRYLSGEQVQAVPPSVGYRLRKAYRRNKTAVRVAAVVFATLLVGLVGTIWQAFRAEQEAAKVKDEQGRTQDALTVAEENRRKAEVTLCRSFLRPIGYQERTDRFDPAELHALRDASATGTDDLRILVVKEALSDPETALRVARRTERFVQATVGSSPARRNAALDLVTPIQNDPKADPNVRLLATWIAIELHSPDWGGFTEGVNHLAHLKKSAAGIDWHNFLTPTLLDRLDPMRAATLADVLVTQLMQGTNSLPNYYAEPALKLVASKLGSDAATRVAEKLISERFTDFIVKKRKAAELVHPLVVNFRAERVDPLIRRVLTDVKPLRSGDWRESGSLEANCLVLGAFTPRASDAVKREVLDALLAVIDGRDKTERRAGPWYSEALLGALSACRPAATEAQLARLIEFAVVFLKGAGYFSHQKFVDEFITLVGGLADRMDDAKRWDMAMAFLNASDGLPMPDGPAMAAKFLKPLSRSFTFKDETLIWRHVIDLVVLGMIRPDGSRDTQPADPSEAAWILDTISSEVAGQVATKYVETYTASKPDDRNERLLKAPAFLAPKVAPAVARSLVQKLFDELPDRTRAYYLQDLCRTAEPLLARLPAAEQWSFRDRAFNAIFERATRGKAGDRSLCEEALVVLVESMAPNGREPYRTKAVAGLLDAVKLSKMGSSVRRDGKTIALNLLTREEARLAAERLLIAARNDTGIPLVTLIDFMPHVDRNLRRNALRLFCEMLKSQSEYNVLLNCLKGIEACAAQSDPETDDADLRDAYTEVESRLAALVEIRRGVENANALRKLAVRMKPSSSKPRLAWLLKYSLDRSSLQTDQIDMESVGLVTPYMTDAATLEAALDHPLAIGPHRAAILKRLEQLRHPLSEEDKLVMFVRDNPGFANWLGIRAEGSPCRYRTAWEYFR